MTSPSLLIPEDVDPFDDATARRAGIDCVNAVGEFLQVVRIASTKAVVTNEAILHCLYRLDSSFASASNYHVGVDDPVARARELTKRLRKSIRRAIQSFRQSPEAPSEGWLSLWEVYRQTFGDSPGPGWTDAEGRIEKVDCDKEGLLNTASFFIPVEAMEHPWHPSAWSYVCQSVKGFDEKDVQRLCAELILPAKGGFALDDSVVEADSRRALMPSKTFRWLHLTDLHFGLAGQKTLWPNIREAFLADVTAIAETAGPWDAVFFTGDFTQRGTREEFLAMEEQVLGPLWDTFRRTGSNPILLAVPGNHDLIRPDAADPSVRQMTVEDRFHEIASRFWEQPGCPYRMVVGNAFESYLSWWSQTPFSEALDVQRGILPGDFSTVLTTRDGFRIGIVGLNTTFLQLVAGNFEKRLSCDVSQLHAVCGDDPPRWCSDKDACILLTHQPPNWFFPTIQQKTYPEINPAGRFVLHFFGHMHENVVRTTTVGGGRPLREWQGSSLFGLELFNDNQERRHGYSAGTLDFSHKGASIRHWPRKAVFNMSSGWRFARDSESCCLQESDGGTEPEYCELREAGAKNGDPLEMRIQRHIQAMDVPDADDRRRAIRVLGDIGRPAKRAIRRLMRAFKDPDEEARCAAGEAVLKMGDVALPYLREALSDPDHSVRGRSASLLGESAPHFLEVIPELIRLLQDPHTGVRRTAAASLEKFGPLAKDAASSLRRLLGDPDRDMRRHAAQTLGKIKTVDDDVVAALALALNGEGDEEARRSIVYALGDIGVPLALDALALALKDPQRHVATLAAEAIGKIGSANDACLSSLVDALREVDCPLLRFNAARTFGIIKPSRPDVIAALRNLAGTANCVEASCAAWALGEIGPAAASSIPELRRLMSESPQETTRRDVAEAQKKIEPVGEQ